MDTFKQVLKLISEYSKDLVFLGAIIAAILGLVFNRLNKRDELKYNSLVASRNTELRNYISLIGELLVLFSEGANVKSMNNVTLESYKNKLMQPLISYTRTSLLLPFLLPQKEGNKINGLSACVNTAATTMNEIVNNRLAGNDAVNIQNNTINKFIKQLDDLKEGIRTTLPDLQQLVRKYHGV